MLHKLLLVAGIALACATLAGCRAQSVRRAIVTEGPRLPVETGGHAGGLVGGVPVVVGGSSWVGNPKTKLWRHECFVLRGGEWTSGPSLPDGLADAAYAWDQTGLYLAGGVNGKTPSDRVMRLSAVGNEAKWEPLPPLSQPTEAAAAAILHGRLYVFGGFAGGKASNQLFALDLSSAQSNWESLAPLPAAGRGYSALVAAGSTLYLFGGFDAPPPPAQPTIFGDAFEYSPETNHWQRIDGFSLAGYAWAATHVGGDEVMLTGRVPQVSAITDEILLLDLSTNQVRTIGKLVQGNCCMPAIPIGSDRWLLPGGEPDTNRSRSARSSVVEIKR